MMLLNLF